MIQTARTPPARPGGWLAGNLPEFRQDMLAFYTRLAREQGDLAAFRLGPRRLLLVSNPDLIEQVLVTNSRHFSKHYLLRLLRPLLGDGLLESEGEFWLRQRRIMQPAFHRQRLEGYGAVAVECTRQMLAGWRDGEARDLHVEMMRLTLDIAVRALLGIERAGDTEGVSKALDLLMHDFIYRFEHPVTLPLWVPTPWNRRVAAALHFLDSLIRGLIRQRRSATGPGDDLLSRLLHARDEEDGRGMTDQQLRDEVMTLFLAGHETTANALAWTTYLLAQHPAVEEKLLREVREVVGERLPGPADLPRLAYTERVVLESMRLYPPVYAFGRQAVRACTIGDFEVPAGRTVIISQWVVHRDPRWWDRPEVFDPDRWVGQAARGLPKYAYFPFGGGPRVCIGNTFALIEATLVLATLVPRFRLRLAPGHMVKPWPSVTLRPAHGIPMLIASR
jgi:cytochrome P450